MNLLDLFVRNFAPEGAAPTYAVLRPFKAWTINQEALIQQHDGPSVRVPMIQSSAGNPEAYAFDLLKRAAGPVQYVESVREAEHEAQARIPAKIRTFFLAKDVVLIMPDDVVGHYVVQYLHWGLILLAPVMIFHIGAKTTRFERPEVL